MTQSWIIHKVFSDGDVIYYGDEVYIANFSYLNQRLAIHRKNYGYITTRKNTLDRWIIESAENKQSIIESDISNPASVYGLSFASENASDKGVILWTRVHQEVYDNKEPFKYQVCHTDKFDESVLEGEIQTSLDKKRDYTVYVDFDDCLERGNTYYYRFVYKGVFSKVGCCQSLRKHDVNVNKFRLAILTFRVL